MFFIKTLNVIATEILLQDKGYSEKWVRCLGIFTNNLITNNTTPTKSLFKTFRAAVGGATWAGAWPTCCRTRTPCWAAHSYSRDRRCPGRCGSFCKGSDRLKPWELCGSRDPPCDCSPGTRAASRRSREDPFPR